MEYERGIFLMRYTLSVLAKTSWHEWSWRISDSISYRRMEKWTNRPDIFNRMYLDCIRGRFKRRL